MATKTGPFGTALLLFLVRALTTPSSGAQATLINFDDVAAPWGFSDTQALRNEYVGLGVSFSAPGNDGGARLDWHGVFAVNGYSSPNFLAFNAEAFYLNGGTPRTPETLTFTVPTEGVRFKVGSGFDPDFTVTARAFDAAAMLLGTVSLVVGPTLATLTVPFLGIKTLVIDFDAPQGSLVIDDLEFPAPMATPTVTPTAMPTPTCGALPVSGCRTPAVSGRALLRYKDRAPDTKDWLQWKWSKGSVTSKEEFGTPLTTTSYQVCVYDGTPKLIFDATIPAGGTCNVSNPKPCWKDTTRGFDYNDKDLTPDGVARLNLRQGLVAGQAQIKLRTKGTSLDDPALPFTQPVIVQLHNAESGLCWEAVYSTPAAKNVSGPPLGQFKDKAD